MRKIVCIGGWGHFFEVFQTLEKYDGAQVCGAAPAYDGEDMSFLAGQPLTESFPMFGSIDEMLEAVQPDIAIVSTQPGYIAAGVVRAAEAGLDIIAEKPLGATLEENAAIAEAVAQNNVRLMAIFSMRAMAVFQTARRLVREGAVGRPVLMNARKSYKYGDEKARPEWFGKREVYSGTFPWIGIHALDMIQFTTGLLPVQVAALHRNQTHLSRPDCEDTCCGIFELEGGAQATVSVDYFRPMSATTHGDDWVRIVGTEGVVEARASENTVTLLKDSAAPQSVPLDDPESLFIPFIEGREGLTGTDDALALSRACLVARQAADENRILEI
ncbi:Gfo/Idh/MocA family protein [Tichowtungia aerotolerans]|uniref:Gfo/Idh/MocA family oxidoreductase n=1 Tax=Tichowtungia aerotolerans TaxID=2697043 RepID=A0A6P1M2E5_9BACT|nr:Gfo/Idh/MocA family oxidoreductase [Tichowtungia aerotolerans]QHI68282.1 Gfo/Idh/MocA family oxidoreductase [Tichowtungia aerotolerans]